MFAVSGVCQAGQAVRADVGGWEYLNLTKSGCGVKLLKFSLDKTLRALIIESLLYFDAA